MNEEYSRYLIVSFTAGAVMLSAGLQKMSRGETDMAVEMLEEALDEFIMGLGHIRKRARPNDKIDLTNALKIIRSHRRQFPRQSKAGITTVDPEIQEIIKKVFEELEI
jgi:ABC-type uncharacterized transport system ATPase subunit